MPFHRKAESKRKLKCATFYIDQKKYLITKVVVLNKVDIKKEIMKLVSPTGHPGTNAALKEASSQHKQQEGCFHSMSPILYFHLPLP